MNDFDAIWEERCELLRENAKLKAKIAELEKPRKPDVALQASLLQDAMNDLGKTLITHGLNHGKVWQVFQEHRLAVGRALTASQEVQKQTDKRLEVQSEELRITRERVWEAETREEGQRGARVEAEENVERLKGLLKFRDEEKANLSSSLSSSQEKVRELEEQVNVLSAELRHLRQYGSR